MRAAEDEGVDVFAEQRCEIFRGDEARCFVIDPSFLDEWDEERTGASGDAKRWLDRA